MLLFGCERWGVGYLTMELVNEENCCTCENVVIVTEPICKIFNESVSMFKLSTMKHGCNAYSKDVVKMLKLPEEHQFESKKYILYDTQYSEPNAQLSRSVIAGRVPKSDPKILMVRNTDTNETIFGIYVRVLKNG